MEELIRKIIRNQEVQIKQLKAIRVYIGVLVLVIIAGVIAAIVMSF